MQGMNENTNTLRSEELTLQKLLLCFSEFKALPCCSLTIVYKPRDISSPNTALLFMHCWSNAEVIMLRVLYFLTDLKNL